MDKRNYMKEMSKATQHNYLQNFQVIIWKAALFTVHDSFILVFMNVLL